jgi:hypothetical protein
MIVPGSNNLSAGVKHLLVERIRLSNILVLIFYLVERSESLIVTQPDCFKVVDIDGITAPHEQIWRFTFVSSSDVPENVRTPIEDAVTRSKVNFNLGTIIFVDVEIVNNLSRPWRTLNSCKASSNKRGAHKKCSIYLKMRKHY